MLPTRSSTQTRGRNSGCRLGHVPVETQINAVQHGCAKLPKADATSHRSGLCSTCSEDHIPTGESCGVPVGWW
jgi:hypothetical protein